MPETRLLTAPELAAILQVNVKELYRKALLGEIPSYRFGKCRRFVLAEVLATLRDEPTRPAHATSLRKAVGR